MGEDQQECDKCKANEGNALMGYPKNCVTEYGSCIEEAKPVIPCAVENAVAQCQTQGCAAAKDPKECIMPKNGGDPSDDCKGCLGCMGGILKDPATNKPVGDWKATQTNLQKAMAGAGQHEELVEAVVEHDDEQCESMRKHIEDQKECDKCKAAKGTEGYPKNCMTYGSCIEEAKPVIPCAVEHAVAQCQAQGCAAAKDPKECIMPKNGGDPSDDCKGCLGCMGGILKDPATNKPVGDWKATQTNLQKAMAGAGQHEELVEAVVEHDD